jgi:hypothetical protein
MHNKKIKLNLVGLDGNAFALLGAFQKQAKKEGWEQEEISEVIDEAITGNYDYLLQTLTQYIE